MERLASIQARIEAALPEAKLALAANPGASGQHSLVVEAAHLEAVARRLRDDPELQFDYLSNVTGVDWLDRVETDKVRVKREYQGEEIEVEESVERRVPGYLEVVYHLYSVARGTEPLVLRVRTGNRTDRVEVPSLANVFRGAELQEREVYDLFGVVFTGHPDLRRLLMWEGFSGHPMRKDYVEPDDYEYEPTPHGEVAAKASRRYAKRGQP